jgi:hypothetical protein
MSVLCQHQMLKFLSKCKIAITQKFSLIYIWLIAFYICSGILLTTYLKQETSLHVLDNYLNKGANPPLYPDETMGALYQLMQDGLFKDKHVAIWMPDSNAHNDAFSLKIASTYFAPHAARIVAINKPDEAQRFDYVISPWEEYSLVSNGAKLIHDDQTHILSVFFMHLTLSCSQITKQPQISKPIPHFFTFCLNNTDRKS